MKRAEITACLVMAAALGWPSQAASADSALTPAAEPTPGPASSEPAAPSSPSAATPSSAAAPAPAAAPSSGAAPSSAAAAVPTAIAIAASDWKFGGDLRLRYEGTTQQKPTATPLLMDPRHKEVMRFRAGVTRNFGSQVTFGARVATGSADDPNSSDVTIGDFADEFEISLDRVFLEVRSGNFAAVGGKFVNPFATTELVWDGDVHTQGVAASYGLGSGRVKPRAVGLLYLVDEQAAGPDSYMAGGQLQFVVRGSSAWSVAFASGYYDYTIKSLRNADTGDTRSNRLAPGGLTYASDFDLLDTTFSVDHTGFGKRFPVRVIGDYVKNFGADDQNVGFGIDVFVGRASAKGDLRFRYGYSQAGTDAVLAAFSHDNTSLATNYRQHTGTFDWQIRKELQLNATWYLYQKLEAGSAPNPWINRLRLNALVAF